MSRSRVKNFYLYTILLLILNICCETRANNEEYSVIGTIVSSPYKLQRHDIRTLYRERRDLAAIAATETPSTTTTMASTIANATPAPPAVVSTKNTTDNDTKMTPSTNLPGPTPVVVSVTQTPLLGENGTGILKRNLTAPSKVSDPIDPDDSVLDVFRETPQRIMAEHHLHNLTIDTNGFYNTTFIGNLDYFNEFWSNITKQEAHAHEMLSDSHRRATTIPLTFAFPFYGHRIQNVTVATGGFLYIGEHIHNWLAATQYIAPLMGNFDTSNDSMSVVKFYDDEEKFVVFWENVNLQEDKTKKFTFAVALYRNGDIVFAYKNIPVDIQQINDTSHPVKVGISDAYLKDHTVYSIRRKTIFEYNKVSFKNYMITNNTIIRLTALPTCLEYNNCKDCLNHETYFNCTWCQQIQKCSSGTDRNKQDWKQRNCPKTSVTNETQCPAITVDQIEPRSNGGNTEYTTDTEVSKNVETVIKTVPEEKPNEVPPSKKSHLSSEANEEAHSPIGTVVASFLIVTFVCSLIAWVVYAFKYPHTRSGQILIKYRPSQWNWRRGEARYTAATIHM